MAGFGKLTDKVINAVSGKKNAGGMESANDQSPAEKEIVSHVKQKVEEIRNSSARITSEGQWLTNSAYLLGFTNLFYDTTAKMFRPINNPSRQVKGNRVEFNYILPIFMVIAQPIFVLL